MQILSKCSESCCVITCEGVWGPFSTAEVFFLKKKKENKQHKIFYFIERF